MGKQVKKVHARTGGRTACASCSARRATPVVPGTPTVSHRCTPLQQPASMNAAGKCNVELRILFCCMFKTHPSTLSALFSATAAMSRRSCLLELNPMQPRSHSLPTGDVSTPSVCFSLKAAVKPIGMLLLRLPRGQLPHFSKTC
jgi:hypothetical protein